jgi:hypothetical protein
VTLSKNESVVNYPRWPPILPLTSDDLVVVSFYAIVNRVLAVSNPFARFPNESADIQLSIV